MVTVGYQYSMDDKNSTQATTAAYENQAFGISFAINDDLTLSYGEHSSERSVTTAATADVPVVAASANACKNDFRFRSAKSKAPCCAIKSNSSS